MTQVSPEEIRPGQEIMIDWSYGTGIRQDIFVVKSLESCSPTEIRACECEGEICCKYRIAKNAGSKWCTRTSDRKFYLTVDLSKINKVMEI